MGRFTEANKDRCRNIVDELFCRDGDNLLHCERIIVLCGFDAHDDVDVLQLGVVESVAASELFAERKDATTRD